MISIACTRLLHWTIALVIALSPCSSWAADIGWVSPIAYQDPANKWVSEALAIDASTTSYASDQSNKVGSGPWLIMSFAAPIRTGRVQVIADFGFGIVDAVDIEALIGGIWTPVFSGAILNDEPSVITFTAIQTDSFRYRFHYLTKGYYFGFTISKHFHSRRPSLLPRSPPPQRPRSPTSPQHCTGS